MDTSPFAMDTSPLTGTESIVTESTDSFCAMFSCDRAFRGPYAQAIAHGALPQGVDPYDPRVIAIRRKCREAEH